MYVTIDFETRSTIDLKTHGLFVYAAHESTEPTCIAICVDGDDPMVWIPKKFKRLVDPKAIDYQVILSDQLIEIIQSADYLVAHNSMFEYVIWQEAMAKRRGWPELHFSRFHDTMAQLAYHALPLSLEESSYVLQSPVPKDMAGNAAMKRICKPRKPVKAERDNDPDWASKIWWNENPDLIAKNVNYCCTDVIAERWIHNRLHDLPQYERDIWLLDQAINLRGVNIDTENVLAITRLIESQKEVLLKRFKDITNQYPFENGKLLSSPLYHVGVKVWVNQQAKLNLAGVGKDTVVKLLADKVNPLPAHVVEALQIRSGLAKSSVAKFNAMLNRMSNDHKVRGWGVYHAASTGRWAAWGVQFHNNPRICYDPKQCETALELFKDQDADSIEIMFGDPHRVASRCIRGVIKAAPGHEYTCTDFSAIEGRGLAYLAGEDWVLEAYRNNIGMYEMNAAEIFGVPYDEIKKGSQEYMAGKVAELSFGYGGGIGALFMMLQSYGFDPETLPPLILPRATEEELQGKYGALALAKKYLSINRGAMSMDAAVSCDIIKRKWRAARPCIMEFWKQLESCAKKAIENVGVVHVYRDIKYCANGDFLMCLLPSGRVMHYFDPSIVMKETDWGTSKSIRHKGMKIIEGKTIRQWVDVHTYSGKLTENVVQGFCRDLLAEAMLRHEAAGYPVVLHVHDEDMVEMPVGVVDLNEFNRIAEIVPSWAKGMPIEVRGWQGERYRK